MWNVCEKLVLLFIFTTLTACGTKFNNPAKPATASSVSGGVLQLPGKVFRSGDSISLQFSQPTSTQGPITAIKLEFAPDGKNFTEVASFDPSQTNYTWKATAPGGLEAKLRLVIQDQVGKQPLEESGPFTVYSQIDLFSGQSRSDGTIDGEATKARLSTAQAMITLGRKIYFTENCVLRSIDLAVLDSPVVTTVAGSPGECSLVDGSFSNARFGTQMTSMTFDGIHLYINDSSNLCLRKIDLQNKTVTKFPSTCGVRFAPFTFPTTILYKNNAIYVADGGNSEFGQGKHMIWKFSMDGNTYSTFAGSTRGLSDNAVGTTAKFAGIMNLQDAGTDIIAFEGWNNHAVRKISIAGSNAVTTLAGFNGKGLADDANPANATLLYPRGVTGDSSFFYLSDAIYPVLRKMNRSTFGISTVVGNPEKYGIQDGDISQALLTQSNTYSILENQIYTLSEGLLRKIDLNSQKVTTIAGPIERVQALVGPSSGATLFHPERIVALGNALYIFEYTTHAIRKLDLSTGMITRFAGSFTQSGTNDGSTTDPNHLALFKAPRAIAQIGSDYYVSDSLNHAIRKIDSSGNVTTIAGTIGVSGYVNGNGTAAKFNNPDGLAVIGTDLYVSDRINHVIRKIAIGNPPSSNPVVTTYSGGAPPTVSAGNVNGAPGSSKFSSPMGIVAFNGDLYIANSGSNNIRKVDGPNASVPGTSSWLTGSGAVTADLDGDAATAMIIGPQSITTDGTSIYIMATTFGGGGRAILRRVDMPSGYVTTLTGSSGYLEGTGQFGSIQGHNGLSGMLFGVTYLNGKLYATDRGNQRIAAYDLATHSLSTAAGLGKAGFQTAPAISQRPSLSALTEVKGTLYSAGKSSIWQVDSSGNATLFAGSIQNAGHRDGPISNATFSNIGSLATEGKNIFVVGNAGSPYIRKVSLETGQVSLLAGSADEQGTLDANIGTNARFGVTLGQVCADENYLYVPDISNHTIRRVDLKTTEVITIAGVARSSGFQNGIGATALFNAPSACVVLGSKLYVADSGNSIIRLLDISNDNSTPSVTTLAGQTGISSSIDATGTSATFRIGISSMTTDGENLYILQNSYPDFLIRRIHLADMNVSTFAGSRGKIGDNDGSLIDDNTALHTSNQILYTSHGFFIGHNIGASGIRWIH